LPDELKRRETRLTKIKEAMSALEEEAKQEASEKQKATEAQAENKQAPASPPSQSSPPARLKEISPILIPGL